MTDLDKLTTDILALQPTNRLRMAADLIDKDELHVAACLVEGVLIELNAILAHAANAPPRGQ